MRKRLRESREELTTKDTFRVHKWYIEYIFWLFRNMNSSSSSSTSGSGSSFSVDMVLALPAIPTIPEEYRAVFWTSSGGGTGDDQVWEAYYGQSRWYPCQKPTTLNGTPGA